MSRNKFKVIIAGGGTGGHVFPAIAIAKALQRIDNNIEILFVGALGKMEMEKVPAAGFTIVGLPVAGLQRKINLNNLKLPFRLLKCMRMAGKIVKNFQPDVVIGVGGYASWPIARIATGRKIPLLLQEQNSFPGLTNRLLAKKASKICVAYAGMEKFFPEEKIKITGNPVRPEIKNVQELRTHGLEFFGFKEEHPTVLVIGGSLGALTINKAVRQALKLFSETGLQLIWQTGSNFFNQEAGEIVMEYPEQQFRVMKFIERMDFAYAAADIIVSRAGAIAVSELCIVGKPVILVPSPNVAEDHQTKNAMALVRAGAALMIPDGEAEVKLGQEIIDLLNNNETRIELSERIARLAFENADDTIAHEIISLIK